MAANEYQVPDLAAVLKTLASLTPAQQATLAAPPEQVRTTPPEAPYQRVTLPSSQIHHTENPPTPKLTTAARSKSELVDPSTITEWSAGLRYVMKIVAVREDIIADIRNMIKVQHQHETEWWTGLQSLIEKQKARVEGQKKLDEVMRAVGGKSEFQSNTLAGPEAAKEELKTYNMKVYRAQLQMIKQMSGKLANLGIPFFGTKPELVKPSLKSASKGVQEESQIDEQTSGDLRIDEIGLIELQKKMLSFLQDLCKET